MYTFVYIIYMTWIPGAWNARIVRLKERPPVSCRQAICIYTAALQKTFWLQDYGAPYRLWW